MVGSVERFTSPHMLKIAIIVLSAVTMACAADTLAPAIGSAEQAIACFQKALNAELKISLSKDECDGLLHMNMNESNHRIVMRVSVQKGEKQVLDSLLIKQKDQPCVFGTIAKVIDSKADIWCVGYDIALVGATNVYLDAMTGKVLCIWSPRGG